MLTSPIIRRNALLAVAAILVLVFSTLVADAARAQPAEKLVPRTGAGMVVTATVDGISV